MNRSTQRRFASPSSGFSLVELMVAMALSLILLAGVLAIFSSSRTTYETTDRLSRIQESGRFAIDVMVRDLRSAGFRGCSRRAGFTNALNDGPTSLMWDFERAVRGFDADDASLATELANAGASSAAAGSDAIVIRGPRPDATPVRATGWMSGTTAALTVDPAADIEAGDVVMVTDCNARAVFEVTANAAGAIAHDAVAADADTGRPGNSTDDIGYAFSDAAEIIPVQSAIYYLRLPDGAPAGASTSLYRRISGGGAPEELVEGVENMQIQYGEQEGDTIVYGTADEVGDWGNVVTVRIALLVRSLSEYGTDAGRPDSFDLLGEVIDNPDDRNMRQVFTTTVNLRNNAT